MNPINNLTKILLHNPSMVQLIAQILARIYCEPRQFLSFCRLVTLEEAKIIDLPRLTLRPEYM